MGHDASQVARLSLCLVLLAIVFFGQESAHKTGIALWMVFSPFRNVFRQESLLPDIAFRTRPWLFA